MLNEALELAAKSVKVRLAERTNDELATTARAIITRLVQVIDALEKQSLENSFRGDRLRELEEAEWQRLRSQGQTW